MGTLRVENEEGSSLKSEESREMTCRGEKRNVARPALLVGRAD